MAKEFQKQKMYLGDSVYAEFDGYGYVVTTENGLQRHNPSNEIYFEPEVMEAFGLWVEKIKAEFKR